MLSLASMVWAAVDIDSDAAEAIGRRSACGIGAGWSHFVFGVTQLDAGPGGLCGDGAAERAAGRLCAFAKPLGIAAVCDGD